MATILEFPSTETDEGRRKATGDLGRSAEVVIFPGVRYERRGHEQKRQGSSGHAQASRDILELVD